MANSRGTADRTITVDHALQSVPELHYSKLETQHWKTIIDLHGRVESTGRFVSATALLINLRPNSLRDRIREGNTRVFRKGPPPLLGDNLENDIVNVIE